MSRVLMIGLDGATFSLLNPLMAEGVMPYLQQFIQAGVHADLMSTPVPLTPPAWISMVTGRSPEVHGVYDFWRQAPSSSNVLFRPYDYRDICCETLWSIIGRQGKRVTSLNFYGMAPAAPVEGYLVAGFTTWKHFRNATYPASLFETMKTLPSLDYRKLGMDIKEEKRAILGLEEEAYERWLQMHHERDEAWTTLVCHLMDTDPTDLTAIVFDGPDKLQHLFWRYLDPTLFKQYYKPGDDRVRELCLAYYRQLDQAIETIIAKAGPEAHVIFTSDHGFGATTEVVHINEWLAEQGFLKWSDTAEGEEPGQLAPDRIKDNRSLFDWEKTQAFCMTASSNGIFLKTEDPDEKAAICQTLKQRLLDYRNPEDGGQIFINVFINEAKIKGKASVEGSPDLTFNLRDGGFASIMRCPQVVLQRPVPEGTHRPNGIFIAGGPLIKQAEEPLQPLEILDIAPTLLYLLGLPIPVDLEGRVPTEILNPEALQAQPVRYKGKTQTPLVQDPGTNGTNGSSSNGSASDEDDSSEAQREALVAQLQLLGYLE